MCNGRIVGTVLLASACAACQRYGLDPIRPGAVKAQTMTVPIEGNTQPPNVVIVLDESGSMVEPAGLNYFQNPCSSTNAACCTDTGDYPSSGTNWCPPGGPSPSCNNPCKWDDMLTAMTDPTKGFLALAAGKAQFGFVGFPTDAACGTPAELDVQIGPNTTTAIATAIQSSRPNGGTPTAATLRMVGDAPNFVQGGVDSYVMLITDGLPNCDSNDPHLGTACSRCADAGICACPVNADGSSTCCNPTVTPTTTCYGATSCLDGAASVAAVAELAQKGIQTIVVGFGAEATLAGPVLSAMATAGGKADICGGYCQANNEADLEAIVQKVLGSIVTPCTYSLDFADGGTVDPAFLVVEEVTDATGETRILVSGQDYTLAGSTVTLLDPECQKLKSSQNQYTLVFGYVEPL